MQKSGGFRTPIPDYEDMLSDPEIDVVYNSLPNSLHAEWSIKSLKMGKHVLCEKPISTSIQDIDSIIKESKKMGLVIAEAFSTGTIHKQ